MKNELSVSLKPNRLYVVSALSRHRPLSAHLNFANSESLGTPREDFRHHCAFD